MLEYSFYFNILIALIVWVGMYWFWIYSTRKITNIKYQKIVYIFSILLSFSWLLVICYYVPFIRPIDVGWYIEFRSLPYIETTTWLLGLFFGILSTKKYIWLKFLSGNTIFFILLLFICIPFIKNIFLPVSLFDLNLKTKV